MWEIVAMETEIKTFTLNFKLSKVYCLDLVFCEVKQV